MDEFTAGFLFGAAFAWGVAFLTMWAPALYRYRQRPTDGYRPTHSELDDSDPPGEE